jgi:hypothetical protein
MTNEKLIVTTSDGTVLPVIMVPARCGRGVTVIIPQLPAKGGVSVTGKRGYTKPSPWPSK